MSIFDRGVSRSRASLAAMLMGGAMCTPALAGTSALDVVVRPLQANASFAGLFVSRAAYEISVANPSSSGVSNVFVRLSARTTGTGTAVPKFVDDTLFTVVPGTRCAQDSPAALNAITCAVGSVPANTATPLVFTVLFEVPAAAGAATTGLFDVTWSVPAGQGTKGNDSGTSSTAIGPFTVSPSTALEQASDDFKNARAASYVIWQYGSTEAGNGELVAGAGTSTKVTLPKSAPVTIDQEETSKKFGSCSPHYVNCLATTLDIKTADGTLIQFTVAEPAQVVLTRALSTLKKGANIANAVLQYRADSSQPWVDIPKCSVSPLGAGVKRCIRSSVADATAWIHTLDVTENGVFSW
jgi:hypothetical protein